MRRALIALRCARLPGDRPLDTDGWACAVDVKIAPPPACRTHCEIFGSATQWVRQPPRPAGARPAWRGGACRGGACRGGAWCETPDAAT